jgi:hypothetical protein
MSTDILEAINLDADDQAEQERQRVMSTIPEETILAIITDTLRHDESELRAYIRQTLSLGLMLDYMPQSTGLRMAQDLAQRVSRAIVEQVAMRMAVEGGRG